MRDAVEEMRRKQVHITIWTETHFEQKHSIAFEEIAEKKGYKTYSITRWMRRFDAGSGGVTIMIDRQFQSREMRKSKLEDLIWVKVEVGKEKMFIGGAYIVPVASSRSRKAEGIVEELGRDVAGYAGKGQVVVAGDWNCKIWRLVSVAGGVEYSRKNTSKRVDVRGRRMVELLNVSEMVILNGIRGSVAQNTCDGSRGQGVDDYIAVSGGLIDKTSNLEYWSGLKDTIHTDHCGVACRVKTAGQQQLARREKERTKGKPVIA